MVTDFCSGKGELLGLCPSNLYKTNRTFHRNEFLWNAFPAAGKGPYGQGELWEKGPVCQVLPVSSKRNTWILHWREQSSWKSTGRRKNLREEHNNRLKTHKQPVLHVQEEQKGCYQLKGDQRIFRLDVGNIFYPRPPWLLLWRVPGDAGEPPWLAVLGMSRGWAWAAHRAEHPGALLRLLQVFPTSVLSKIKQEECIITFSQISVDVVKPPPCSAFLCSCTAPLLEPSFLSTKPKIAACCCQNQHSKPHSQKTKSTQSILHKFWQKKLSVSLSTPTGNTGVFSIYQDILIFENLICPKPKRRITILNP